MIASDWQPIETAPRDGTIILLYCPYHEDLLIERYSAGSWDDLGPMGQFVGESGQWFSNLDGEPTHWMPLEPPKTA